MVWGAGRGFCSPWQLLSQQRDFRPARGHQQRVKTGEKREMGQAARLGGTSSTSSPASRCPMRPPCRRPPLAPFPARSSLPLCSLLVPAEK